MKKTILSLVLLASLFTLRNNANAQSNDKAAVEKLVHTYFDALNASDADKATSLFTENGVLLPQGAPTATGSAQINGTFKYVFDNFKFVLEVSIAEITVQGNYAIVSSTSKGSFVIKAKNETIADDYRETFVMQKINGTWKIARYMYNKSK